MFQKIIITSPVPLQEIGAKFNLVGSVPKSLLVHPLGVVDMRLFIDYIDIEGKTFIATTLHVRKPPILSRLFSERCVFGQVEERMWMSHGFIEKSQGRITLKISGHEKVEPVYIPLIVKGFEPKEGVSPEIAEKHAVVGETIKQYEQDLEDYYKELEQIRGSRKAKNKGQEPQHLHWQNIFIASEIFKILDESEESFVEYAYSEEDSREQELEEKYKNALNWRGPLLRGMVSQFGGYELTVYSNDHGNHFHIIHKGKGINARFSFPEMKLVSYSKSENTIGSKEEKKIREYCLKPDVFEKFEKEFQKRTQIK
jgi:hypothetical protein